MIYRILSSAFVSNRVYCDTVIHDALFDVHIPKHIFLTPHRVQQDLFATAHRCMNNWCFFKPARAYVLGLFVDHATLNRLKTHAPQVSSDDIFRTDCPKSFILFFASSKNSDHVKNGFRKSFENFVRDKPDMPLTLMTQFLAVMEGRKGLERNDFIRISCLPSSETVVVSFKDEKEIQIKNANGLILWVHSLYVGLESNHKARYGSMQTALSNEISFTE